jgi:hypothetical protein
VVLGNRAAEIFALIFRSYLNKLDRATTEGKRMEREYEKLARKVKQEAVRIGFKRGE